MFLPYLQTFLSLFFWFSDPLQLALHLLASANLAEIKFNQALGQIFGSGECLCEVEFCHQLRKGMHCCPGLV